MEDTDSRTADAVYIRKPSAKENFLFYNNMVCVIKGLEGDYTTIDLRNESCVTGKIVHVDAYMNIELENCYFYSSAGVKYPFESFFVKGRTIRYVHIPSDRNIKEIIESSLNPRIVRKHDKKLTFKKKRALNYQKQILSEIANS